MKFDLFAPGGELIKKGIGYDIGNETKPISRLLGLGYRRLPGYQELATIDNQVFSLLDNEGLNQEIAIEANELTTAAQPEGTEEINPQREAFQSPEQELRKGLSQKVEDIIAEDGSQILLASVPQIQENLLIGGDLVGMLQLDGSMLYTNTEDFGQDYQLELAVHSPQATDNLEDIQASLVTRSY